jgi:hypothetical protein
MLPTINAADPPDSSKQPTKILQPEDLPAQPKKKKGM